MEYNFSDRMKNMGGNAIREIFKLLARPDMMSFAGGFPSAKLLACRELGEITARLITRDNVMGARQIGRKER